MQIAEFCKISRDIGDLYVVFWEETCFLNTWDEISRNHCNIRIINKIEIRRNDRSSIYIQDKKRGQEECATHNRKEFPRNIPRLSTLITVSLCFLRTIPRRSPMPVSGFTVSSSPMVYATFRLVTRVFKEKHSRFSVYHRLKTMRLMPLSHNNNNNSNTRDRQELAYAYLSSY